MYIKIEKNPDGSHAYQIGGELQYGWAIIPNDMVFENFPFGEVTTDEIDGVMTVTSWTPGTIPEPEQETEPTTEEKIASVEQENKILSQQIKLQAQQQEFLENCILEIGDVVYA